MNYIALYRKYRPSKLSEVVGQDSIVELLKNMINMNKISHAYILSGPRGTGKTSIAKIFAKSINCENPQDGDQCEECNMCIKMKNNSMDIIEIDAASNNGVDEIREIRENSKLVPNVLKYKVYIIDEVHMLSTSAFNALLKTLEEPPKHVIFILATTEISKIPSTVLSRCMRLDFKKIDNKSLQNRLNFILKNENKTIPENVLNEIIRLSNGGLRDAINYLDQAISVDNITIEKLYDLTGEVSDSDIEHLFATLTANNISKTLDKINYFFENGKNFELIAEKMLILVRNILIEQSIPNYFQKNNNENFEQLLNIDSEILYDVSKNLINLSSELKKNNNQKLIFEIYMIIISEKIQKEKVINKISEKEYSNINEKTLDNAPNSDDLNSLEDSVDYINKSIRVNNTFASASKEILNEYQKKYLQINDYLYDKKYNNITKILMFGQIVLASEKNIVIKFKNETYINMLYLNLKDINYLINKILDKKVQIAAVSEEEWNFLKKEYVDNKKMNNKYTEKEEIELKKIDNKDKIEEVAENIFGEEKIEIK